MIKPILVLCLSCLSLPVLATEIILNIQGINDAALLESLKTHLSIKALKKTDEKILSDNRVNYLHAQAESEIQGTLKQQGYYQPELKLNLTKKQAAGKDPVAEPSIWQADYQVQLGLPVYIKTVDIQVQGEGKDASEFKQWLADFSLKAGDKLHPQAFHDLQQQFKYLSKEQGYIEAQVLRHEIVISDNKQAADLYLSVDTGKRYEADALKQQITLHIEGTEDEAVLANIRTYSSLYQQGQSAKKLISDTRVTYLHKQAEQEIRHALQPFGYYHPSIKTELKPRAATDSTPKGWEAFYTIKLGEPTLIKVLDIQLAGKGKDDPVLTELIAKFPLKQGARLQHAPYESLKKQLKTTAENYGYFEALTTRREIRINPESKIAAIHLHFDTGQRYRFGEIKFSQTRFQDWVLRRYVGFQPGDYYDRKTLLDFRRYLGNSGYFKEIEVKKTKNKEAGILDLEVITTLARADSYRIRVGYGTDSALRLGLDAGWAQLNRYGHSVKLHSKLATNKNRLLGTIEYRVPTGSHQEHYFSTILGYRAEDFDSDDIGLDPDFVIPGAKTRDNNMSLGFQQHRIRSLFGVKIEEVVGLSYTVESYNLLPLMFTAEQIDLLETLAQGGDPTASAVDLESLNPSYRVLAPKISWIYTDTDNPIYTTHGQQVKLSLMGARKGFGSNVDFWQISLHSAMIRRLHEKGRLILRGTVAYTDAETINIFGSGNTFNRMPKSLQFRTGGDRSVRGYGFQSLDGGGETLLSAKHILTTSVEYEYRFLKDWSWAAFVDSGNAFNDFSRMNLETGVGTGIRWHSPVGLVRMDIAFPTHGGIKDFRFHLNIGPDF